MKIELKDILKLDSFKDTSVVAGAEGLSRPVNNISVMEVPDIDDFIQENDFLLTTFYPIYKNENLINTFIPKLIKKGLCGIGLKLNRYIDVIPEILIEQGNKANFPIISLPQSSNFSNHINDFLKYKNEVNARAVKHRDYIHNILMDLMVKGHDFRQLAKNLSEMLQKSIVFLDADFDIIEHYSINGDSVLDANTVMPKKSEILNAPWDDNYIQHNLGGVFGYVYIIKYSFRKIGFVIIYSQEEFRLSAVNCIAVEQHAIVFTILVQKNKAVHEVEKRYTDEFVFDLISGKIEAAAISNRSRSLNFNLLMPVAMALILIGDIGEKFEDKFVVTNFIKYKALALSRHGLDIKENLLFGGYENYIVVLFNGLSIKNLSDVNNIIVEALEEGSVKDYQIGVSEPVTACENIASCFRQAKLALEIKRNMKENGILYFKDAGIFKVLHSVGDRQEMVDFCQDTIGALIKHDRNYNTELLDTLRSVIEADGNLKKAANQMYIHYNTLRYRFKKIEDLLGKELSGIIAYHDVYLALKIYDIYIN